MMFTKKVLALCAVVGMTAALGSGCAKKPEEKQDANAKVSVKFDAAVQGDIQSVVLTIDSAPGGGGGAFPIVANLTKAATGNVWTANVTQIPAAASPGVARTFTAAAYNGTGGKIYEGSTVAQVISAQTAQVTIIMQELNVPPGPENYAPVITALTSTAAYVLPGQSGTFSVSAYDPDDAAHYNRPAFNGSPLAYQWAATCDVGTLTIASPTSNVTGFTVPNVPSALCTVSVRVSETALANNTSVTTYFTVTVNGNFGDADVFAFPNTAPIVTVRGDFRYNFFADVTTIPVGQQADLFFTATDPDGDNVRFDLASACGTGFDAAGALLGPVAVPSAHFSATSLVTAGPGNVAPPTAASFNWSPTFGYGAGVNVFTNPAVSCSFTVTVSDLCTSGNCNPGTQGGRINGADRGGVTTGRLNATAPSQPRRAPSIARVTVPNQSGAVVPAGSNTWDPKKYVVVTPGSANLLTVEGLDQPPEVGPLTAVWSCNVGSAFLVANTQPAGPQSLKSVISWVAPAALLADMSCTATITSTATTLSTVATIRFAGSDPCIGQPNGTACNDGNACTTGETCQASVCTPATTVTCSASDACHVAGVCDPNTGVCSNPNAANGTACNADSNGCTQNDACVAGTCTAGSAPSCNSAPNAFCYQAAGACGSTGNNTFACSYTVNTGATCSVANAGTKCNGAAQYSAFACDAAGACVGSGSTACPNTTCAAGNVCQAGSGACGGGSNTAAGTPCDDGNTCTVSDACNGSGTCAPGAPFCAPGSSCNPVGPVCVDPVVVPALAKRLEVNYKGLAQGIDGSAIAAGKLFTPTKIFDGVSLTSAGAGDVFVAKFNAAGVQQFATRFGDAADQDVAGTATTLDGTIAVVGFFTGALAPASLNTASPTPVDYLLFLDANGVQKAGAAGGAVFNNGIAGRLQAINANPNQNLVAVCGYASVASDLVTGSTFAGGTEDLVVALFNASTGARLWSRQIGGTAEERCNAVLVDDNGDVYMAGQYDGPLDLGLGALPNPASSVRRHVFVAKLNGTTGATLQSAAFGNVAAAGNHNPRALGRDAAGNLFVAGFFTNTLPIGATSLVSAGAADTFVAKLDGALAPLWAVRMGASGADELRGLAVDSFGNPSVVGLFSTPLGTPTTGFAALTAASTTASDAFVAKLSGATGLLAAGGAAAYGDGNSQSANAIVINRLGVGAVLDDVVFSGAYAGGINFGAAGNLTTTGTDMYLTFSNLQ